MATPANFKFSGNQSFAVNTNWDIGAVPNHTNDAEIGLTSTTTVTSSAGEQVNSIGTGSADTLYIRGGTFDAINGTGPNANLGVILVTTATFEIDGGTFENGTSGIVIHNPPPETLELDAQGSTLLIGGSVSLTGHGNIEMAVVSGDSPLANIIEGTSSSVTLTNVNNDISGTGAIGQMNFINESLIETNNPGSSVGGNLAIIGSDAGGSFVNTSTGTLQVDNGGTMELGTNNGQTSIINNQGLVSILGSTQTTTLTIGSTLDLTGGGKVELEGTLSDDDYIESYNHSSATLNNENNTISGGGQIGDGSSNPLTVDNEGIFDADGSTPYPMYFFPSKVVNDGGTLEATNRGGLSIADGTINNTGGTIQATGGGVVGIAFETITGLGSLFVGQNSGFFLDDVTIAGSVQYTGPNASIFIETPSDGALSQIDGGILGAQATDTLDLNYVPYALSVHAVWQQTSSTGGTLSLYSNGADLASFNLGGQFTTLNFAVSKDGSGGSLITVQSTPSYAENSGDNDEWIMADGQWGASAGPGSHPSGYNVAGTGDWTGNGTDGILWFDPTTGDVDEWQLSNTQWSASVDLGAHPANPDGNSYQIAGTDGATDFSGNGIDDLLRTSTNSDGTIATDIWKLGSTGNWANSVSPGSHPAGYTVAGTGDWTGNGTDGILWYNASNGDTDEWQLSGGNWAASVDLGGHPANGTDGASYQIAGVGDFFDNGRDDVLWTSVNSDGTVATDIWELGSAGQWIASTSPGNHPARYSVVGVGDFTGTGTSDILWYDASTGDADEWLIKNGAWAGSVDLGTHPGGFQVAGVGDFNGDGTKDILWHSA
jgi:hypothetical protein